MTDAGDRLSLDGPPFPTQPARHSDPADRHFWTHCGLLVVIAALAGLSYAWALNRDPLEPYYAAAVRSMSTSWHDFVFGAVDPAGTITLDKLPGAFWVQALSVRIFGFHTWSMVLPQAVEGVLTVLILYRAVRRLAGPTAGLVAAFVLAVSPATVALNRGNISDSLMILLVVLGADAVSAAIGSGSQGRLVLAGIWVGLAFQAKMIEAWMVLPAFGVVYLLSGPGATGRRVRQLLVAGLVAAVVSLSWMTAVLLVPSGHRPYVDGSHDNSTYAQVFVYNGFGRLGDETPLQLLTGPSALDLGSVINAPPAGPARLLHGDFGRDVGWLLPTSLVVGAWGIFSRRRRPRGDPARACFVLWEAWLVTLAVVFSVITTLNSYYTAALAPAAAALLGAGVAEVWRSGRRAAEATGAGGSGVGRRVGVAVVVAGTVAYAAALIPSSGAHRPGWLLPATIAVGGLAVVAVVGSLLVRRAAVFGWALAAALVATVFTPAVASAELATHHASAFDTPFEPVGQAQAIDALFVATPKLVKATVATLEGAQRGAPDLLAAQTAAVASEFIYVSGREALPIGGFTGTFPSPTLKQLQADVRQGRFHLVIATSTSDPRIEWIASHCLSLTSIVRSLRVYYCTAAGAGPVQSTASAAPPQPAGQPTG